MTDALLVILDDAVAGSITRLPGGKLRFAYHDDLAPPGSIGSLSLAPAANVTACL
ncbi:MAG TPA: hypothetical protein VNL35_23960 [Chloroflexota bacterium]|nr:hypothetical protein [Chloroflexota bacterium]